MVKESKKASNAAWDKENMVYQTVKVRKEILEEFKAKVKERGDKVNTVLRDAMVSYSSNVPTAGQAPAGLDLPEEALQMAKEAAEKDGVELAAWICKAIEKQNKADNDARELSELLRSIPNPSKQEPPKKEEMSTFNGDFYARHQEYLNRAKEGSK